MTNFSRRNRIVANSCSQRNLFFSIGSKRGFSLIEVILATAILMGSVIVLARLVSMGRTRAEKAATQTRSQQLCENTLNELLLGLRPLEVVEREPLLPVESVLPSNPDAMSLEEEPFGESSDRLDSSGLGNSRENLYGETGREGESEWLYSVRIEPIRLFDSSSGSQDFDPVSQSSLQKLTVELEQADETLERPVRFSLTRWVRSGKTAIQRESENAFDFGAESGGDLK